jgi:hypothetical protein
MASKPPARRRLDGSQQSVMLTAAFPSFRQIARGNPFVWVGTLTPGEMTATYKVRISYSAGQRPLVDVLDPKLVPREEGGSVPHTFRPGRICLHLRDEWDSTLYLHQTIVPWASLWLFYYEVWHATGEWLGGGHEPGAPKTESHEP